MGHESSGHQAYTVNRLEHGGMRVVKTEKLNTCKIIQEEITGTIISH
jgi:hypothetical protein